MHLDFCFTVFVFVDLQRRQRAREIVLHFRCHSIANDEPPAVDPFALVAEDIAPLSERVSADLRAKEPVLTASAQHFFGAGSTR